jgi:4-alpha-glucanotransferase
MDRRGAGVLLHISSLPSPWGVGDLGPEARAFADFLAEAGQTYWQVLPLNPTDPALGNSPYSSSSAFACNSLFISPADLASVGLLSRAEGIPSGEFPRDRCDYGRAIPLKEAVLARAWEAFRHRAQGDEAFEAFCSAQRGWLDDYALFTALKRRSGGAAWSRWPRPLRHREAGAMEAASQELAEDTQREKFIQFLFFSQWAALKVHCIRRGVRLMGDLPIYVSYDSADVWAHPDIFKLDAELRPTAVAGVPPDYFSRTGQLWGNPVYRWDALEADGFDWWLRRMAHQLDLFDVVRIDHFRGLVAYWEVPADALTAAGGRWVEAPAEAFLNALQGRFRPLPVVAEDLGVITPDVREMKRRFGLPGMKVLLFAFGEDHPMHPYLPHTYERNCVVYTGTHDNTTVRGWFDGEATADDKRRLFRYLGAELPSHAVPWAMIRLAMASVGRTVIVPMQDLLGLGEEARMNRPSVARGNWQWRLAPGEASPDLARRLRQMTETYGRVQDRRPRWEATGGTSE